MRTAFAVLFALAVAACVTAPGRYERYTALNERAKADYDKYNQFMTENQQERYLAAQSDDERAQMIVDLHVEERLGQYPEYIRQAIWSHEVVAGMDKGAVFMTWGKPDTVDREQLDDTRKVATEYWYFRRGPDEKQDEYKLHIENGIVTQVEQPNRPTGAAPTP